MSFNTTVIPSLKVMEFPTLKIVLPKAAVAGNGLGGGSFATGTDGRVQAAPLTTRAASRKKVRTG
jgi:hypothetical protein